MDERDSLSEATSRFTELRNASGQSVHLERDARGLLVSRRTDEGVTTFEHDAAGRVVRAVWPEGELLRTYDMAGRLLTETVNGRTLTNSYDAVGRRISRTTPSGAESTWRYGFGDQPEAVEIAGRTAEFVHNVLGQEIRRAVGAVEVTRQWESGRLRSQYVNGVERFHTWGNGSSPVEVAGSRRDNDEYEVDGGGNAVAMPRHDHDADGRVVRRAEGDRVWRFRWDALDQLVAVVTPDEEHWRCHYDPFGRRIAEQRVTPDGVEVLHRVELTWDADAPAEQRSGDDVVVWDDHHQVERSGDQAWSDARFRIVVKDFTGAPVELLEEDGSLSWRAQRLHATVLRHRCAVRSASDSSKSMRG